MNFGENYETCLNYYSREECYGFLNLIFFRITFTNSITFSTVLEYDFLEFASSYFDSILNCFELQMEVIEGM